MLVLALLLTGSSTLALGEPGATASGAPVDEPPPPSESSARPSAATTPGEPVPPGAPEQPEPSAPSGPRGTSPREPVVTQACEAQRQPASDPAAVQCTHWRLEWSHEGKVWGALRANSPTELQKKRARHLGFVRRYARAFDTKVDPRYADPSPLICDQCDAKPAQGRWGEGQTFSGLGSARALASARKDLADFERLFYTRHAPEVAEVARLAGARKSASLARRYAKQLNRAASQIVAWQAQLDRAELVRSQAQIDAVTAAMRSTGAALDQSFASLGKQVAAAVAKAHRGTYTEETARATIPPVLEVGFEGRAVTATYRVGEASSVWFEGEVALDGSIAGRSLMAPTDAAPSCPEHTEACGYRYIPALIRFRVREQPRQEVLELWFQQDTWVRANPFSRR